MYVKCLGKYLGENLSDYKLEIVMKKVDIHTRKKKYSFSLPDFETK